MAIPADRHQRLDGARSRRRRRRSAHARLLRLGGARAACVTRTARLRGRRRSCRLPAPPPTATSRRSIRASPIARHSATGIRRFRSICAASARSTRTTGSSIGRRRRRSCRSRSGSSSGARVTAIGRRSASGRGRQDRWPRARDRFAARVCREHRSAGARASPFSDVRAEGLAASRGATDFGEYFTYFSFFLVGLGAAAGGAVLQARRRAARARGRPAARGRLHARPRVRRLFAGGRSAARGRRAAVIGVAGARRLRRG